MARERRSEQTLLFGEPEPGQAPAAAPAGALPGEPFKVLKVHFETLEDIEKFAALTGQRVSRGTESIWWPAAQLGKGQA